MMVEFNGFFAAESKAMNSRQRMLLCLEHKIPDRVPCDLAGTHVTGIHVIAYKNLCSYLGIDPEPMQFSDVIQQIVIPNQKILDYFEIDTRGLFPLCSHNWNVQSADVGDYLEYRDEWGFVHHKPKEGGLYWSLTESPINGMSAEAERILSYPWPKPDDRRRIEGLREQAIKYRLQGKIVIIKGLCAGLFEMAQRVRGMENILCDLLVDPKTAEALFEKLLEIKQRFWTMVFEALGDVIDIAVENDDYGTQDSQLISPEIFRQMLKPRLFRLIETIKTGFSARKPVGEKGYVFFHSCGNVRPLLPDFIEMGIDIINPVHINAVGMEPKSLKKDFGRHITFWGGGIETQKILPTGTPQQVRDDVRSNLEALMSGGGYVFNAIHNIQADVTPENIIAMWEAYKRFGVY